MYARGAGRGGRAGLGRATDFIFCPFLFYVRLCSFGRDKCHLRVGGRGEGAFYERGAVWELGRETYFILFYLTAGCFPSQLVLILAV